MCRSVKNSAVPKEQHYLLLFHILNNIRNLAVKNKTQRINRFDRYILAMLHSVQDIGGKSLFIYQVVFRYAALEQCLIKRLVADHDLSPG